MVCSGFTISYSHSSIFSLLSFPQPTHNHLDRNADLSHFVHTCSVCSPHREPPASSFSHRSASGCHLCCWVSAVCPPRGQAQSLEKPLRGAGWCLWACCMIYCGGAVPHTASAAGLQRFSGDTGETLAECFIIDASPQFGSLCILGHATAMQTSFSLGRQ